MLSHRRGYLGLALVFSLLVGCSSAPDYRLEKKLEAQTTKSEEVVGVRDDKVVIQKRGRLKELLFSLRNEVQELQQRTYGRSRYAPGGLWLQLKQCQSKLSDPRIGGNGTPPKLAPWVDITQEDKEVKVLLTEDNKLETLSEEDLNTRIQRLQAAKRMLRERYNQLDDMLEICQHKYRTALLRHGITPEEARAQGEWVEGPDGYKVWRLKRPALIQPKEKND